MSKSSEELCNIIKQASQAKKKIAPLAAAIVIDAVKKNNSTEEMLQLIGIMSGQGIPVEELLIAIREQLNG